MRTKLFVAAVALSLGAVLVNAQQEPPPGGASGGPPAAGQGAGPGGGQGGGRGGRGGGLPGATPEQIQAVNDMNTALASLTAAVTTARNELATATFTDVKNEAAIKAAVEKLKTAELALAIKRAEEFAKLQAGPNKLNADQVNALIAAGGALPGGRGAGPGRGGAPDPNAPGGRGRGTI